MADVFVANRHSGDFIFPFTTEGGLRSSILLEKGHTTPVPQEVWNQVKGHEIIQFYLDRGHLEVLREAKDVAITETQTSEPPIPLHLQDAEQPGNDPALVAKVRRSKRSTVEVG